MPRLLSAADSFNSSGATIIPGRDVARTPPTNNRNRHRNQDTLGQGRMLMPQDTLGLELENALVGMEVDERGLGGGAGEIEADWGFLREYTQLPNNAQLPLSQQSIQPTDSLDFSAFLNSQPTQSQSSNDFLLNLQLDQSNTPPVPHLQRPSTSHSHRSETTGTGTGSEYSYTTTDVSGSGAGDVDMEMEMDGWRGGISPSLIGGDGAVISPRGGGVVSPGEVGGMEGVPLRVDDRKKADRLEHRRSINRRSAQKHRLRRKEELETLNRVISDRDARIAQLERDLAVERAKLSQLVKILQMNGVLKPGDDGGGGGGSVH